MNIFKRKIKKYIDIKYSPKEDITAYETAQSLVIMIDLFNWNNRMSFDDVEKLIKSYPDNVLRHFKIVEN